MQLSIIVPVLNEAHIIQETLASLAGLRKRGHEIIVVDGGSQDDSVNACTNHCDQLIATAAGRAQQMNAGAQVAHGDVLLFLHADTQLPELADICIQRCLSHADQVWGRFDVRLSGKRRIFRIIENMMNLRSRLTGIATGDQAVFVKRHIFKQLGGFPDIELMEDIALSKILKRLYKPACISKKVSSSSRRWEQNGIYLTIFKMWRLRLAFFLGADTSRLARSYYGSKP